MAVDRISGQSEARSVGAKRDTGTEKAGGGAAKLQDQFMQILLTQLKYQDPMAPMQEKDFFAQMAQFTTAAAVEDLNGKIDGILTGMAEKQAGQNLLLAARLIGNLFQAKTGEGMVTGVIESVRMVGGRVVVGYRDMLVSVEDLCAIGGVPSANEVS